MATATKVEPEVVDEDEATEDEVTLSVLDVLLELEQQDKLTPEHVVAIAADPDSPLHARIFNDSDDQAAYQWRKYKARRLIDAVKIRIESVVGGETRAERVRAFTYVPSSGAFKSTERAFRENREEVVEMLKGELHSIRRRFGSLTQFAPVVREELLDE